MDRLEGFLIIMPVLLLSMVAHEYAHGYAAFRQGDPTAWQLGRLTWNPIKHIDPFMTILLPVMTWLSGGFIFGGAKPVPVVPRNYRHFKRGDIIVSLAGIAANLGLYLGCAVAYAVFGLLGRAIPAGVDIFAILQVMAYGGIIVNLMLAMFNLLPIPPLDGSHVMKYLLPPAWALRYQQVGRYGILILVLLMTTAPGRNLLFIWRAPALMLERLAMQVVAPLQLSSPFTESLLR